MPEIVVVLVEPRIEGNVGAVARSMANFGLQRLVLVRPCALGEEAWKRAKHGAPILRSASTVRSLKEALDWVDLVVGTTGIPGRTERAFYRQTLAPWELFPKLVEVEGRVGLLLGRENYGLYNDELDFVDILVNIPCDASYPVMNISHAAAVLFYEFLKASLAEVVPTKRLASGFEKKKLMEAFRELLLSTRYAEHKRRRTEVMFRRLVGRALPTKWEFHALMGVLRRASKTVTLLSRSPGPGPSS